MRFFVDIDKAVTLHLEGAELLVFSALSLLASKQPWNGSAAELAAKSRCGSRMTAARAAEKLASMGLINLSVSTGVKMTIELAQNGQVGAQNEQVLKESNKENINNIFKGEGDISRTPTREFGENNFSKNVIWDRPATWQECRDYCYQFHGTKETYEKFYRHYEATGWFGIKNWRAKLRNWIVEDTKRDMLELQRQQRYDPNYR